MNKPNEKFAPHYTPKEMLSMGIFGGTAMKNLDKSNYPKDWFENVKLTNGDEDISLNKYKVGAESQIEPWQGHGGWDIASAREFFEWYCDYFLGKRDPERDKTAILRWHHATGRHMAVIRKRLDEGRPMKPKYKQVMLHWGWKYSDDIRDESIKKKNNKRLTRQMSRYEWVEDKDTWRRV